MEDQTPTFVQKTKSKLKENRDKALLVAVGVGALSTAYFYGKTKGAMTVEMNLISRDEEGNYQKNPIPYE